MMTHDTRKFFISYAKTLLLLQRLLTQVPKDQITVLVKLAFLVGGVTTVDFK